MKRQFTLFVAILFSLLSFSKGKNDTTQLGNSFFIAFSPVLYNSMQLSNRLEGNILRTRPMASGMLQFGFRKVLNENSALSFSTGLSIVPYKINIDGTWEYDSLKDLYVHIDETSYGSTGSLEGRNYKHIINSWTLEYERFFSLNSRITLVCAAGARLNINVVDYEGEIGKSQYPLDTADPTGGSGFEYRDGNVNVIQESFSLRVGLEKTIESSMDNAIRVSLIGNYSPRPMFHGSYRIRKSDRAGAGTSELGINYLGIELAYILGNN